MTRKAVFEIKRNAVIPAALPSALSTLRRASFEAVNIAVLVTANAMMLCVISHRILTLR